MALGVERYRLKVRTLAEALGKSPQGMSHALTRGILRRVSDRRFRTDLEKLDRLIGEPADQARRGGRDNKSTEARRSPLA